MIYVHPLMDMASSGFDDAMECDKRQYHIDSTSTMLIPASPSLLSRSKRQHTTDTMQEEDLLHNFESLPSSSKAFFLNSLINHYLPSELLSPLYLSLQPLLRQDFFAHLPTELSFYILDHLDLESLVQCLMVSKCWNYIVLSNTLTWKKHYHEEIWSKDEDLDDYEQQKKIISNITQGYMNDSDNSFDPMHSSRIKHKKSFLIKSFTKNNYIDNSYLHRLNTSRRIRYMWQKGSPKSFSFRCHDSSVITCLQLLDSNRVISASDDGTIRIWCLVTGRCLTSFLGHTGGVWALHILGSFLLSGSTDRSCRVWRLANGECLGVLIGHTSTVRCAELYFGHDTKEYYNEANNEPCNNGNDHMYAVSGSRDNTLRIWDLKSMTEKRVLYGHLSSIRCIVVDRPRQWVISGSYDCTARIWDLRDGACLRVLLGHSDRIYSICLKENYLATGGLDANVHIWDIRSGECLHILEGHRGLVGSLQFYKNTIVSGNTDGTLRIWDLKTGECLVRIRSENGSTITCLQADYQRLIVGCDKYLRLWDPKTGAFIRDLITGIDTVWRVAFDDYVCTAACQTEGVTTIYVFRFDGQA